MAERSPPPPADDDDDDGGAPTRAATRDGASVTAPEAGAGGTTAPPPPSGGLEPGLVLSHTYEIERLLARGGMGEVYRARNLVDGSRVALKVIRSELADDPRIRDLFSREAGILRRIRHDAVVGYGGLLRDEQGRTFLVMDFVNGPSLAERLKEGPLAVDQVRRLKERLARGLAVVHDAGTYHRDLSPDNILLPEGDLDRATIIDFGIAKQADPAAGTVIGRDFAGKFSFVSPEHLDMVGVPVDQRSDIYSLGLVLAAAAAGRPLDMGQSWGQVIAARRRVPDLSVVPEELRAELAAMLDPDPGRRPQSMRALLTERRGDGDRAAGDAGGAVAPEVSSSSSRSRLVKGVAAAVAAVVVIGCLAYWALQAPPPVVVDPADGGDAVAGGAPGPAGQDGPEPQQRGGVVGRAEVAAALQRAVDPARCAQVDFAVGEAGAVELSGFVEAPEVLTRITEGVRAVDGVREVGAGGVAVYARPFCTALGVLRRGTTQPAPPAGIALRPSRPDAVFREGQFFVVTVEMPEARSGYLYVDYIDSEGLVVHLLPNTFAPENRYDAGARVRLGAFDATEARATGKRAYEVTAPFGRNLIMAVVSPEPLFDGVRDETESAEDYLPALAERLKQAGVGTEPTAAARFIETKPRDG